MKVLSYAYKIMNWEGNKNISQLKKKKKLVLQNVCKARQLLRSVFTA